MVSSNVREGAASTMTTIFRIDVWNWRGNPSKASATSCSNSRRRTLVLLRPVECQHGFDRFLQQWSLLLLLPKAILPYPVLGRMSSTIGSRAAIPQSLVRCSRGGAAKADAKYSNSGESDLYHFHAREEAHEQSRGRREHDGEAQHRIAQRWHPQLEEEALER